MSFDRRPAELAKTALVLYGAFKLIQAAKSALTLKNVLSVIPGGDAAFKANLAAEVRQSLGEMSKPVGTPHLTLDKEEVTDLNKLLAEIIPLRAHDAQADGRHFAYLYDPDNADLAAFMSKVTQTFANTNALNPIAFPALRKFEVDVLKMTANLLNCPSAVGAMTSGGTESIICAIKVYRDRARQLWPWITQPEVVLPVTAHVAFPKAGCLLDVRMVFIPLKADMTVDMAQYRAAINRNTILLVGSAPQYPHGIVDPIEEIASLAKQGNRTLPVHVDACVGGFILPFVERLGYPVPLWDFRVPNVTSISADVHKFGYSAKGASTITYRDAEVRKFQYFAFSGWPGGLFVSPSLLGTRGGGPIASAWAIMAALGEAGFVRLAKVIMDTRQFIMDGVATIPELALVGTPHGPILAVRAVDASRLNILCVADIMETKGWGMERQQQPPCIHMTLMPRHAHKKEQLIADLRESVEYVLKHPELAKQGSAAMYGMVAKIPSGAVVEEFLLEYESQVYDLPRP